MEFRQKRACNYANPFMRENTRGYRRKTVNLHVELVSDELWSMIQVLVGVVPLFPYVGVRNYIIKYVMAKPR